MTYRPPSLFYIFPALLCQIACRHATQLPSADMASSVVELVTSFRCLGTNSNLTEWDQVFGQFNLCSLSQISVQSTSNQSQQKASYWPKLYRWYMYPRILQRLFYHFVHCNRQNQFLNSIHILNCSWQAVTFSAEMSCFESICFFILLGRKDFCLPNGIGKIVSFFSVFSLRNRKFITALHTLIQGFLTQTVGIRQVNESEDFVNYRF